MTQDFAQSKLNSLWASAALPSRTAGPVSRPALLPKDVALPSAPAAPLADAVRKPGPQLFVFPCSLARELVLDGLVDMGQRVRGGCGGF